MRHLVFIVMAIALGMPCYGQSDKVPAKAGHSVQCKIQADGKTPLTKAQRVSKGKTAILHVSLENLSDDAIEITEMVAFLGTGRSSVLLSPGNREFDAPIDIEKKSPLELTLDSHGVMKYPEQRLTVAPHQLLVFDLDIAKLKWEQMSSSSYSATNLWATVPFGSEYLSVIGHDALGRFEVGSNEITLEVSP